MDNIKLEMEHRAITDELTKTCVKKNTDYGNSYDKSLDEFGLVSGAIRMQDKINRLKQLTNNDSKVESESIEDTLMDLANYAILTVRWLREQECSVRTDVKNSANPEQKQKYTVKDVPYVVFDGYDAQQH